MVGLPNIAFVSALIDVYVGLGGSPLHVLVLRNPFKAHPPSVSCKRLRSHSNGISVGLGEGSGGKGNKDIPPGIFFRQVISTYYIINSIFSGRTSP